MTITKSDFLQFLEAPIHLWAHKHNFVNHHQPSAYSQYLINQGYEIENLVKSYFLQYLNTEIYRVHFQNTYNFENYEARVDIEAYDPTQDIYDLYEVKSTCSVKKEHLYDVTFQALVVETQHPVRNVHVVTLNPKYLRNAHLEIDQLFTIHNVNSEVDKLKDEVITKREMALKTALSDSCESFPPCSKPSTCPCHNHCHPHLPKYSIYNIPCIKEDKLEKLRQLNILDIHDIPDDFKLSPKQKVHVEAVQKGQPHILMEAIKNELSKLKYPLYFFDYETFGSAIPIYQGYSPHQHMVFQYSLHIVPNEYQEGDIIDHVEFIADKPSDPALQLLEHLKQHIGDEGTILVWNKHFEMGRNVEMANRYPEYAEMLKNMNHRIYDLGDSFKDCYYVHPEFYGSWSIKNVLPVLVPHLSYKKLAVQKGDEAMMEWWKLVYGDVTVSEVANGYNHVVSENGVDKDQVKKNLLAYCKLDTWAMVEIWQKLKLTQEL